MKGRVYSRQRCSCGAVFKDNGFTACECKKCGKRATGQFYIEFRVNKKEKVKRHFNTYMESGRFLSYLRHQTDIGQFDIREHMKDQPLAFDKLAMKWLEVKEGRVERKHYCKLSNVVRRAIESWGDRNIKGIVYADIEDFLFAQRRMDGKGDISDKMRSDFRDSLHNFWQWLRKRRVIKSSDVPEFPDVPYELALGKILDKETQIQVVEEVKRLTFQFDPKVWLGILWLQTYPRLRPKELWEIREQDIDLGRAVIIAHQTKEGKAKIVPLIDEDVDLVRQMKEQYPGFPDQFFFRHPEGVNRAKAGDRYGKHYFSKWWNRACKNLGVEGVPLYRGTKHSTVTAMRGDGYSPEEIKRATGHSTNKAFDRYLHIDEDEIRKIFATGRRPNAVPFKKTGKE